jgi:hypothetical protein
MFRFQSFHMYGIIGSAVAVGAVSVWLIKRFEVGSLAHCPMEIPQALPRTTMVWTTTQPPTLKLLFSSHEIS